MHNVKVLVLLLAASLAAKAQGNRIQICDQQTPPHCITIKAPSSIAAAYTNTWPSSNAIGALTNDGFGNLSWGNGDGPNYLYVHFRDDDDRHNWVAYSGDASHFRDIRTDGSIAAPSGGMRDTSITYRDKFYFVASPATSTFVQFYTSTDLITFSSVSTIDISAYVSGATAAWAPEWFYDPPSGKTYFVAAISTAVDPFAAGAPFTPYLFEMNLSTLAVVGSPTAITFASGVNVPTGRDFDFNIYYDSEHPGYHLFYVDQINGGNPAQDIVYQPIAHAMASALAGPYTQQTPNFYDYVGTGDFYTEGMSAFDTSAGCARLVFDHWTLQPVGNGTGGRMYHPLYRDSCEVGHTLTGAANVSGSTVITTPSAHALMTGDHVTLSGFTGGWAPANGYWQITNLTSTTFSIALNSSTFGPFSGTAIYTPGKFTQASFEPPVSQAATPLTMAGGAEHGTVIKVAGTNASTLAAKAAAHFWQDGNTNGRFGVNTTSPQYTFSVKSRAAFPGWIQYAEMASIGLDSGSNEYAMLGACGTAANSCSYPWPGAAQWVVNSSNAGSFGLLQINNSNDATGETGILFSNGVRQFGPRPLTTNTYGDKSLWSVGQNNQAWASGAPKNAFFVFNGGIGEKDAWTAVTEGGISSTVANCFGMKITVGASPIQVTSLGRWVYSDIGNHTLYIMDASGNILYNYALSMTAAGATNHQFVFTPVIPAFTLAAGTTYYIMSSEIPGSDPYQDDTFSLTPVSSYVINGAAHQGTCGSGAPTLAGTGTNKSHGVTFRYSDNGGGAIGGFPIAVSPFSGETRLNWGLTFGTGDGSAYSWTNYGSIDTFGSYGGPPYKINMGTGTLGSADANVYTGTLRLGTGTLPTTGGYIEWIQNPNTADATRLGLISNPSHSARLMLGQFDATPDNMTHVGADVSNNLDLHSSTGATIVRSHSATDDWMYFKFDSGLTAASLHADSGGGISINSNNSNIYYGPDNLGGGAATAHYWFTSGTQRMRLAGTQLAIGTAYAGTAASGMFTSHAGALGTTQGNFTSAASFGGSTTNETALGIHLFREANGSDWTSSGVKLCLNVDNSFCINGAYVYISHSGAVGIGVEAPHAKLDIAGNLTVGTGIIPANYMQWTQDPTSSNDTIAGIIGNASHSAYLAMGQYNATIGNMPYLKADSANRMTIHSTGLTLDVGSIVTPAGTNGLSGTFTCSGAQRLVGIVVSGGIVTGVSCL